MADAKNNVDETSDGAIEAAEEVEVAEVEDGTDVAIVEDGTDVAEPTGTPRKAPLGAKEVPAFKWKLLGTANYATLTLFKAVEREDAEAQLERVRRDGYYGDLEIVDIDAKVQQPKPPASVRKQRDAQAKKDAAAALKASKKKKRKKAPRSVGTIKVTIKASAKKASGKKVATKKGAAKKAVKKKAVKTSVAKKKAPPKKAPPKKAAKRTTATKKTAAKKSAPAKKKSATRKTGGKKRKK